MGKIYDYYYIFLRFHLFKISCGKGRKWHFRAPNLTIYGEACPQPHLVLSSFGGLTFLPVRTPTKSNATPLYTVVPVS